MKIKGIKKAVGEFKRANRYGDYSPNYGFLMLDRENGNVWTDSFYSIGRSSYTVYNKKSICNLSAKLNDLELEVNMKNVKIIAEKMCNEFLSM